MSWFGPKSEMDCVRRHGVTSTVVINYMIYRRSNIISIITFALPLLACKLKMFYDSWSALQHSATMTNRVSFSQWQLQGYGKLGDIAGYTIFTGEQLYHSVLVGSQAAGLLKIFVAVAALLFATVLGMISVHRWHNFKQTRPLLLAGWLALCFNPFIQAMLGINGLSDLTHTGNIIGGYYE